MTQLRRPLESPPEVCPRPHRRLCVTSHLQSTIGGLAGSPAKISSKDLAGRRNCHKIPAYPDTTGRQEVVSIVAERLESKKLEQELKALIATWRKSEKRLHQLAGSQADSRKPGLELKLVGKLMSSPDAVAELGSILSALAPG